MTTTTSTSGFPVPATGTAGSAVGPVPAPTSLTGPTTLVDLGRRLIEQGSYADGVLALRRRLRLAPGDPEAHYLLAVAAVGEADIPAALDHLERAAGHPVEAAVALSLGRALQDAGDLPGARRWLTVAAADGGTCGAEASDRLAEVESGLNLMPGQRDRRALREGARRRLRSRLLGR